MIDAPFTFLKTIETIGTIWACADVLCTATKTLSLLSLFLFLFLNKLRHDKHSVDLLFLLWRNVHIVAVEVREISVGVARSCERLALEADGAYGEDAVLSVHYAVAVVYEDVRHEGVATLCGERPFPS